MTGERADRAEACSAKAPGLIVTIDGPAGTGKSSVSREVAKRLGLEFLDTGAMYRAATALAIDRGVDLGNGAAIASLAREAHLRFDWKADPPTLLAHDRSVMSRLREPDVDSAVSGVSGLPEVRAVMVEMQKRIGREHPRLVTEGRDQGTVVFPDAAVKIYLDASARTRATRRAEQLRRTGISADVDAVERELIARDEQDSRRPVGPLRRPADAALVDTSGMGFEQVVGTLVDIVRRATRAPASPRQGAACGGGASE